jgi:hypothetical protein
MLTNTDGFKHALAERRADLVDPIAKEKIARQIDNLASRVLDRLAERVEENPMMKIQDLLGIGKLTITPRAALPAQAAQVQNNYIMTAPAPAKSATEWLQNVADRKAEREAQVIDLLTPGGPSV